MRKIIYVDVNTTKRLCENTYCSQCEKYVLPIFPMDKEFAYKNHVKVKVNWFVFILLSFFTLFIGGIIYLIVVKIINNKMHDKKNRLIDEENSLVEKEQEEYEKIIICPNCHILIEDGINYQEKINQNKRMHK